MAWQTKLIRWYRKHKRDLPWRRNPTPYRVLVSEFMLQQTTVKTVIPYYRRFLKRFPSLTALANADEMQVLTAWSGLGYYARARNLHKTAQICRRQFKGRIPRKVDALQSLPGIGAYTAGAIASIAYEEKAPIVDGNVARVLSRMLLISDDPKTPKGQKNFWMRAVSVLPQSHFGDFNQALMELGAVVCTPTRPNCQLCPIQSHCVAFSSRQVDQFPKLGKRTTYRRVHLTAALIAKGEAYLMVRRPSRGLLRDMWEFPTIEGELEELSSAYSLPLNDGVPLKPIRHGIMEQRITVTPWLFVLENSLKPRPRLSRWVRRDCIGELPTSSLVPKLAAQLP